MFQRGELTCVLEGQLERNYFFVATALNGKLSITQASIGSHFMWTATEVTGSVLLIVLYLQVPSVAFSTFVLSCFPVDV